MKKTIIILIIVLAIGGFWYSKRVQPPPPTPEPTPQPTPTLTATPTEGPSLVKCEAPDFSDDLPAQSLMRALGQSLKYYDGQPATKTLALGDDEFPVAKFKSSIHAVLEALDRWGMTEDFYKYLRTEFQWYKSNIDSVLFTGYYLASLRGSRKRTKKYRYPLYRRPHDLCRVYLKDFPFFDDFPGLPKVIRGRLTDRKRIVPYYTRDEIDYKNRLKGKNLELLWVDSAVDRFFLQVQGSGIVTFADGSTQRVNYADSSGHTYRSIGKHLIAKGILTEENVSMKAIRAYLEKNPKKVRKILTHDPSYVFFRLVDDGPFGCLEVPITAYRSIATDRKMFPAAALGLISTEKPKIDQKTGKVLGWKKFTRLIVNQDTGGAIKGPGRVDLFCGYGRTAEITAGHMKQDGMLYFFIKN